MSIHIVFDAKNRKSWSKCTTPSTSNRLGLGQGRRVDTWRLQTGRRTATNPTDFICQQSVLHECLVSLVSRMLLQDQDTYNQCFVSVPLKGYSTNYRNISHVKAHFYQFVVIIIKMPIHNAIHISHSIGLHIRVFRPFSIMSLAFVKQQPI